MTKFDDAAHLLLDLCMEHPANVKVGKRMMHALVKLKSLGCGTQLDSEIDERLKKLGEMTEGLKANSRCPKDADYPVWISYRRRPLESHRMIQECLITPDENGAMPLTRMVRMTMPRLRLKMKAPPTSSVVSELLPLSRVVVKRADGLWVAGPAAAACRSLTMEQVKGLPFRGGNRSRYLMIPPQQEGDHPVDEILQDPLACSQVDYRFPGQPNAEKSG